MSVPDDRLPIPVRTRLRARACAVRPGLRIHRHLPNANHADAFCIALPAQAPHALDALIARRGTAALERVLSVLRDQLVRPFGLKPIGKPAMAPFQLLELDAQEAVYGVDDRHCDVRLSYTTRRGQQGLELVATTLVKTHNGLGRFYLRCILPFHGLIVRRQLQRIVCGNDNDSR